MHTLHPLELSLYSVPVRLHVLSVDSCRWIYKVQGLVHSVVDIHGLQLQDTVVGSPLITVVPSGTIVITPSAGVLHC